ncbi:MAG: hypothetical protein ACE5I5_12995 [Candidatus Heimdallarchaeota archaeon]
MARRQLSLFLFLMALCLGVWGYILSTNRDLSGQPMLPTRLPRIGLNILYISVVVGLVFLISLFLGKNKTAEAL